MKRKRAQATIQRDSELLTMIKPIKADHPLWGYRRIWSYLKYRQEYPVCISSALIGHICPLEKGGFGVLGVR